MITIKLTEEEAQYLYDEVAGVAGMQRRGLNIYERHMIQMCRKLTEQLEQQGVRGVLARSWNERAEEMDAR